MTLQATFRAAVLGRFRARVRLCGRPGCALALAAALATIPFAADRSSALSGAGSAAVTSGAVATSVTLEVVDNPGSDPFSIREYPTGSAGEVEPSAVIAGANSGLDQPFGIAVDSAGNIYVANVGGNAISEYSRRDGATPIALIAGSMTGLSESAGVAVDRSGGIWVVNASAATVTKYAPGTNGDLPPIATLAGLGTGFGIPFAIAADNNGDIYIGDLLASSVSKFAARADGNVEPIMTISGGRTGLSEPVAIALDAHGNIYVANNNANSITRYAAGAIGDATPLATISGPGTGLNLPSGIAVDDAGDIYVANAGAGTITEYAAGSDGDAVPIVTIAGARTGLTAPRGIAIAPSPTATGVAPTPTATPSARPSPTPTPIRTATPAATSAPVGTPAPTSSSGGRLRLSSTSIEFPSIGAGTKPVARKLTIGNSGRRMLVGSLDSSLLSKPFRLTGGAGAFALAPHRVKALVVWFAPVSPGTFTGTIGLTSNDPLSRAVSVLLSGTGLPGKLWMPDALDFGNVAIGKQKVLPLRIGNAGPGVLHCAVDVSGLGAPFAAISGAGQFTISSGQVHKVKVRFNPGSRGRFSGILTISSDDPGRLPATVTVTGAGV
jgi:HYDIN/CFA65/VesB family protein/beta-propeller repeat-containing protein